MIEDVAPHRVRLRLDVDQAHSSLAIWRQLADTASLPLCCPQTLTLLFICSLENRAMVLDKRLWPAVLPLIVIQLYTYSSKFSISSREAINHSRSLHDSLLGRLNNAVVSVLNK